MTREFEVGDDGTDVQQLQEALESLGYTDAGTADGRFSEATKEALSRFQSDNYVSADGRFTPDSQTALLAATSQAGTQWQFGELFSDAGTQDGTAGGTQYDTAAGYSADTQESSEGLLSNVGAVEAGTTPGVLGATWTGLTEDDYRWFTGESSDVGVVYRSYKTLFFAYVWSLEQGWPSDGVTVGVHGIWKMYQHDPAFVADTQKAGQEQWEWEQKLKETQKNQKYMWEDGSQSTKRERETHEALKGLKGTVHNPTGHMEPSHSPGVVRPAR